MEVRGFEPLVSQCEICAGPSRKELRGVENWGRCVRNHRSVAVNGRIGSHDPPRFAGGLPGRYGHWLLPICCPDVADPTFETTIRITPMGHRSCLGRRAGGLRLFSTVGDLW